MKRELRLILNSKLVLRRNCPPNSPATTAMTHTTETVLSTLPSSNESERLLVVLVQTPGEGSHMELRQQSYSKSLGWFTQSSIHLEPSQVAGLKNSLGAPSAARPATRLPREFSRVAPAAWQPRVVHADSA